MSFPILFAVTAHWASRRARQCDRNFTIRTERERMFTRSENFKPQPRKKEAWEEIGELFGYEALQGQGKVKLSP
jgi:hypothetical protein